MATGENEPSDSEDETGGSDEATARREAMLAKVETLRTEYRAALPGLVGALLDLFEAVETAPSENHRNQALSAFSRKAHEITGSAGLFGLDEISETAGRLETHADQCLMQPEDEEKWRPLIKSDLDHLLSLSESD